MARRPGRRTEHVSDQEGCDELRPLDEAIEHIVTHDMTLLDRLGDLANDETRSLEEQDTLDQREDQ